MVFVFLFMVLVLIVLVQHFFDDLISRVTATVFTVYWGGSLILSCLDIYELNPVRFNTYVCFYMAMLFFLIGMFCIKPQKSLSNYCVSFVRCQIENILSNKIVYILLLIFSCYLFRYALLALSIAEISGKGAMQSQDVSEMLNVIPYFEIIYGMIAVPIFHMVCPLLMYMLMNFSKKYLVQLFSCVLFIVVYAIINGGRSLFVILMLYFFITYTCTSLVPNFKIKLKKLLVIALSIFVVLFGIAMMTQYRDTGSFFVELAGFEKAMMNSSEKIGFYSTLPFALFDYAIENDYFAMFNAPFYGRATFSGLDIYFVALLKMLGININSTNVVITQYLQNTWVPIGPRVTSNYAYSGLLQHYLDFGYFGIAFFPFVFGALFRKIIDLFLRYSNIWIFALLSISFFMAVHSIFACFFIKNWIYWYFAFLLFMFYFDCQRKR